MSPASDGDFTTAALTNTTAFLRCSVLDRGSGILPSMISQMAAGSFQLDMSSTRHTEAGIGFGLSISKLIAEQVGGQLSVRSKTANVASPSVTRASSADDLDISTEENSHRGPFVCTSARPGCASRTICPNCEEEFIQSAATCFTLSIPVTTAATPASKVAFDDCEPALDNLQQRALASAPAFQSRVLLQVLSTKAEVIRQRAAMRILLVEDSLINIKVLCACLSKRGFTNITVADNGQEACDVVSLRLLSSTPSSSSDSGFPFSVVLMDCEMPVMDGFVCSTRLKAIPHCCPIFALTANATNDVRRQCALATMDMFFSKPLRTDDLIFALALLDPFKHYLMQHSPHALAPGGALQ